MAHCKAQNSLKKLGYKRSEYWDKSPVKQRTLKRKEREWKKFLEQRKAA